VLHPGRVEGRAPVFLVVPRELEIIALARHAHDNVRDAGPGVQPRAEGVQFARLDPAPRQLPYGLAERVEGFFGLPHQYICFVT